MLGKTYEAGLRGRVPVSGGRLDWKVGVFRTDSSDDIITLASTIQGRGFFQNVDATRRQGFEASAEYHSTRWLAYASYSFLDATFQFTGDVASPNNPSADANGNVFVTPGKRIPVIPQHQFKAGLDYFVTPQWKVGGDLIAVGSTFFVGDEANQNDKLPGYWLLNLHTSYQIDKTWQVFGLVNNVFNKKILHGTYLSRRGQRGLPVALTDQRTGCRPATVVRGAARETLERVAIGFAPILPRHGRRLYRQTRP